MVLQNTFDTLLPNKWEKYIKYADADLDTSALADINQMEDYIIKLSDIAHNSMMIIGICCVIIDRENLWVNAGSYKGYLDYAESLLEKTGFSIKTISKTKTMAEAYIDNFYELKKVGFLVRKNATKLQYLPSALLNHDKEDVFRHIMTDNFSDFVSYAQSHKLVTMQEIKPSISVTNDAVIVDGVNILSFPPELDKKEREYLSSAVIQVYTIRKSGDTPVIFSAYDEGEKTAILNFIKKRRQSR